MMPLWPRVRLKSKLVWNSLRKGVSPDLATVYNRKCRGASDLSKPDHGLCDQLRR